MTRLQNTENARFITPTDQTLKAGWSIISPEHAGWRVTAFHHPAVSTPIEHIAVICAFTTIRFAADPWPWRTWPSHRSNLTKSRMVDLHTGNAGSFSPWFQVQSTTLDARRKGKQKGTCCCEWAFTLDVSNIKGIARKLRARVQCGLRLVLGNSANARPLLHSSELLVLSCVLRRK